MNKILLVDNYDSFTFNLYHLVQKHFKGIVDVKRDYEIDIQEINRNYIAVIFSPGPGNPDTTPIVMEILKNINTDKPILGICLGMQCINNYFNGQTVKGSYPIHGKVSKISHTNSILFSNIPTTFNVARYHSLVVEQSGELIVTAKSEDGVVMALEHPTRPIFGTQYHPESFLTQYGDEIIINFLRVIDEQ